MIQIEHIHRRIGIGCGPFDLTALVKRKQCVYPSLSCCDWRHHFEHTKTKVMHPQTSGICERFHKTLLQEFYQLAFRRKIYRSIEELQVDLAQWLQYYNYDRTHQGKMCCGRTPIETLIAGKSAWEDKINQLNN